MKIGVLLVHGIGIQGPDWAEGIIRALRDAVAQALPRVLGPAAPPVDAAVEFEPAYWEEILREREQTLERLLESARGATGSIGGLLRQLVWWLQHRESRFIADYLGDIIGYLHQEARKDIQQELCGALERMSRRLPGSEKRPLTVVAHSLGTVISSEYVWDRAKARGAAAGFDDAWRFDNFFTIGSPLALFSLRFGGPEAFGHPVALEHPRGRWVNLFDANDPVGMPLRPLNEAYARAVLEDVPVESGIYLLAHARYFTCPQVLAAIGRKVALDWAALNGRLAGQALEQRYAEYDQWIREQHA